MSARSKARKQALDLLFEADIRKVDPIDLLNARIESGDVERPLREFAQEILRGVGENRRKIDELIATYATGWDMDRLPTVDRNILRIAIYEIIYNESIDDAVAIDEALNLAKDLSTDDSSGFIHGLLARISSIKSDLVL